MKTDIYGLGEKIYGNFLGKATGNVLSPIQLLEDIKFIDIANMGSDTCAIDENGKLYAWGLSNISDSSMGLTATPTDWGITTKFKKIFSDSLAGVLLLIDEDGNLWGRGYNTYGLLATGNTTNCPIPVKSNTTIKFDKISIYNGNCAGIDTSGNLFVWGQNYYLGYGNGVISDKYVPYALKSGTKFKDVQANGGGMAIDTDGNVWTWGLYDTASKINSNAHTTDYATKVSSSMTFEKVSGISAGIGFYICTDGNVYGYGTSTLSGKGVNTTTLTQITRNAQTYTVNFYNEGTLIETQKIIETENAIAPNLSKQGYILSWDKDFSNVTTDLTVNAIWTPNANTVYKVEHYKQNTALTGYNLEETESLTGTTGTNKTATAKTYLGFTENITNTNRVTSGTVASDGSLVLKLYYDRNSYTVTLNTNSGTINSGNITSYTYGIGAKLPTNITRAGYIFGGWYENSSCTGTDISLITTTDTGNKTYYAKWTANSNTAYTVVHQKMNLDGTTYTIADTENKIGTTGASVTPAVKTYEGFTSPNTQTVTIAGDGSTQVIYKYTRNKYTFTLGSCEGVTTSGSTPSGSYYYGDVITLRASLEAGYKWEKWSDGTLPQNTTRTMPASDLTCTPIATKSTFTITYILNGGTVEKENPTTYDSQTPTFTLNNPSKVGYTFIGWTGSNGTIPQTNVSIQKGSTGNKTFTANWKIESHTVIFKDGNKVIKTETVNYSSDAIPPLPTKPGYILSWDKDFSNITSDAIINTIWTPRTDTKYKVEHYKRTTDLEVVGYTLSETEYLEGTTDELVTANSKDYDGFTENSSYKDTIPSGRIAGDGSLVLKLYYDRNTYNINYELNGGTSTGTLVPTYTYGKQMILSTKITKSGYVFGGWYDNNEFTGERVKEIGVTETGDKIFYAKWLSQNEYYITSDKHNVDTKENYVTQISSNTNVKTFINNVNTNGNKKILNSKRQQITSNDMVGTGCILQVEYGTKKYEYEVVVKGDLDGNGKVTVTDLAKMNQALVGRITLNGAYEKASDLDSNKKLTITDLSRINQAIVGRIQL